MTLQALYGTIPQINGKGECARVSTVQGFHLEKKKWIKRKYNYGRTDRRVRCTQQFDEDLFVVFAARRQHDAEDEEGVCRQSESDLACV